MGKSNLYLEFDEWHRVLKSFIYRRDKYSDNKRMVGSIDSDGDQSFFNTEGIYWHFTPRELREIASKVADHNKKTQDWRKERRMQADQRMEKERQNEQ